MERASLVALAGLLAGSLAASLALIAPPAAAQELSASVVADGYSFTLGEGTTSGGDSLYFTTYDGSPVEPLGCGPSGCTLYGEVRPTPRTPPGSRHYRADYLIADALGVYEYGAILSDVSSTDADGDTLPDALEVERAGDFSLSGSTRPHLNAFDQYVTSTFAVQLKRAAGSRVGTYSGWFSNTSRYETFSGSFFLSGASGRVSYQRGGDTLRWELTQEATSGPGRHLVGTSQVVRNGATSITIPAFVLDDTLNDEQFETRELTLQRHGSTYRGNLELEDGEPSSPWRDFRDYLVEIRDPNDLDGDGVPDLSYVPEPGALAGPLVALASLRALWTARRRRAA